MDSRDAFKFLKNGDGPTGIRLLEELFTREPGGSAAISLGVGYLWLGNYARAWQHFTNAQRLPPGTGDLYYRMSALAKWCQGERQAAVKDLVYGLDAKYSNSLNLGIPLLLFFVSVREPALFSKSEATKLLIGKLRNVLLRRQHSNIWPVPLVSYVLGSPSSGVLEPPNDHREYKMEFDFYGGTLALAKRNTIAYLEAMRSVADTNSPGWYEMYPSCLWHPEFFLARHEATRPDGPV